ncbi:Zinc finger protein 260 [Labeo rohita]|uniref:Zinc finger protein 260 n=1 Tax=Labeo rohita TaxID=84645 RepID=A0ABQ8MAC7_LABRO|nr:Zinc finger protein 260 [Labeo rohita]
MSETLQLPALQIQGPADGECNGCELDSALSSSSSLSLRRKRFKMRRMKNVMSEKEQLEKEQLQHSGSKEYLQLPSIEITPSSDEDAAWSSCSTPSASPQRRRFLLRKWLRGGEKKEHGSESSSQQSSLQSSHEEESTRYLSPNTRDDSSIICPTGVSDWSAHRLAEGQFIHL